MNLMRQLICYALSLVLFVACNQSRHVVAVPNSSIEREAARAREIKIKTVYTAAKHLIGKPYRIGSSGPKSFDCSGFTCHVFQSIKLSLPRTATDQARLGSPVNLESVKPGDLLFFGPKRIDHVSLVSRVKSGKIYITHATTSNGVVEQVLQDSDYWLKRFKSARRVII